MVQLSASVSLPFQNIKQRETNPNYRRAANPAELQASPSPTSITQALSPVSTCSHADEICFTSVTQRRTWHSTCAPTVALMALGSSEGIRLRTNNPHANREKCSEPPDKVPSKKPHYTYINWVIRFQKMGRGEIHPLPLARSLPHRRHRQPPGVGTGVPLPSQFDSEPCLS